MFPFEETNVVYFSAGSHQQSVAGSRQLSADGRQPSAAKPPGSAEDAKQREALVS